MNTDIIGVWSVEALFKMGSQSDEIFVFNQDGTGWLESINYQQWSADFFYWSPTSSGWMAIEWTKHIEPHKYTRKIIESASTQEIVHTSAYVKEECTPSGLRMKVLHIQIFDDGYNVYGLVSSNPQTRIEPTGQII